MNKEPHVHKWSDPKLQKINKVQKDYPGSPGDKAFLVRACECKATITLDYGETSKMIAKGKQIKALDTSVA